MENLKNFATIGLVILYISMGICGAGWYNAGLRAIGQTACAKGREFQVISLLFAVTGPIIFILGYALGSEEDGWTLSGEPIKGQLTCDEYHEFRR